MAAAHRRCCVALQPLGPGQPFHVGLPVGSEQHVACARCATFLLMRPQPLTPHGALAGGNMVSYVTKKRETKNERGGLCLDEDEARYFFRWGSYGIRQRPRTMGREAGGQGGAERPKLAQERADAVVAMSCKQGLPGRGVHCARFQGYKPALRVPSRGCNALVCGCCASLTPRRRHLALTRETCLAHMRRQLISAVEYCHKNNVAHRDLKLDNTLLDNHDPAWLKLCDFGFAKHWQVGWGHVWGVTWWVMVLVRRGRCDRGIRGVSKVEGEGLQEAMFLPRSAGQACK